MPKRKLDITDQRMLDAIDILKQKGTIRFVQQFCDEIGLLKQNLRNIKKGHPAGVQHFTAAHIASACKAYNINANWIVGNSPIVFNQVRKAGGNSHDAINTGINSGGIRATNKVSTKT